MDGWVYVRVPRKCDMCAQGPTYVEAAFFHAATGYTTEHSVPRPRETQRLSMIPFVDVGQWKGSRRAAWLISVSWTRRKKTRFFFPRRRAYRTLSFRESRLTTRPKTKCKCTLQYTRKTRCKNVDRKQVRVWSLPKYKAKGMVDDTVRGKRRSARMHCSLNHCK